MANFDSITSENNKKWSYIPDHPYRILMTGGSKSGKINVLINLINDLSEQEILIKKRENVGIKHYNDINTFIGCSGMYVSGNWKT